MSEEIKEPKEGAKESWFAGLKSEFSKITWLPGNKLARQTFAVIVVSVIVGFIIAVLDLGIQYGVNFLTSIGA